MDFENIKPGISLDDQKAAAGEIARALRGEGGGQASPKPEPLPEKPTEAQRQARERDQEKRTEFLLAKQGLTPDEQVELAGEIGKWIRGGRQ